MGIGFILAFLASIFLIFAVRQRIISRTKFYTPDIYNEKVREVNRNVTQIPPFYHGYNRGFANITRCNTCRRTALREDQHPADCCPECGGEILDYGSGKWDGIKWIKNEKISHAE